MVPSENTRIYMLGVPPLFRFGLTMGEELHEQQKLNMCNKLLFCGLQSSSTSWS